MTPNYDAWTIELAFKRDLKITYRILTDIDLHITTTVVTLGLDLDSPEFRAFILKRTIENHERGIVVGPSEVK